MSVTDVMDDVDYINVNFNINEAEGRHPLWMTESHFVYHLFRDDYGHLNPEKDGSGEPICSPRNLSQLCMNNLVCNPGRMIKMHSHDMPFDLYPAILSEAIFQRELHTITFLVSTWPHTVLDFQSVIPSEDLVEPYLLSNPIEVQGGMSIMDSIMHGFLRQKPTSRLRIVNFTGFKQELKICKEVCRLPILWMNPEDRKVDQLHEILSRNLEITKEKVERYLNKISCIYAEMDPYVQHGNQFDTITIVIDCKLTMDDVPIGLALQDETPFRFACQRLWIESIPEVGIPLNRIKNLLEPRDLTHLEVEDSSICKEVGKIDDLLDGLLHFPNLQVVSLPTTISTEILDNVAHRLNETLRELPKLRKLNFSGCYVKDNLHVILNGLKQDITCVCLRDCRLTETDLQFLLKWDRLAGLIDLNLSRNSLKTETQTFMDLVGSMPCLACFSISYCSLPVSDFLRIVNKCKECKRLKTLAMQSFTPLSQEDAHSLLQNACEIQTLQKCLLLPEAFAFPGSNEVEWQENRSKMLQLYETILAELGRPELDLE